MQNIINFATLMANGICFSSTGRVYVMGGGGRNWGSVLLISIAQIVFMLEIALILDLKYCINR